jgi:hypothetical protein
MSAPNQAAPKEDYLDKGKNQTKPHEMIPIKRERGREGERKNITKTNPLLPLTSIHPSIRAPLIDPIKNHNNNNIRRS